MTIDNHVSVYVVFDIPEGQSAVTHKEEFYVKTKAGTKECLYYGFASLDSRIMCREGYKTADGFLEHVQEVGDTLGDLIGKVGKENVKILCCGPKLELEKIKPNMDSGLAISYLELESEALMLNPLPSGCPDTHVTIIPEFTIPDGRMEEFKTDFQKFVNATKDGEGASGLFYYGLAIDGNVAYCREGFKDAESVLRQEEVIKEKVEQNLQLVEAGKVKINVVGSREELDKLTPKLQERGAILWELDSEAFFM